MTDMTLQVYDDMREEARAIHTEGSWYVGRFDDVWSLLTDDRLGAKSNASHTDRMTPQEKKLAEPLLNFMGRWPVFTDMPDHTALHRLILPCFAADPVKQISKAVAEFVASVPRPAPGDDLLASILRPACIAGLAEFLGVAPQSLAEIGSVSGPLIAFAGLTAYHDETVEAAAEALERFTDITREILIKGDGILSNVLRASLQQGSMDWDQAVSIFGQMVTGFLQPTLTVAAFAAERILRASSGPIDYKNTPEQFLDECLRLSSPFHFAPRRALVPLAIGTETIPADARVVLVLVAANRDPRRFNNPLEFRTDRGLPAHISFARGRYGCIGARTAREVISPILTSVTNWKEEGLAGATLAWQLTDGARLPLALLLGSGERSA